MTENVANLHIGTTKFKRTKRNPPPKFSLIERLAEEISRAADTRRAVPKSVSNEDSEDLVGMNKHYIDTKVAEQLKGIKALLENEHD